MAYRNHNYNIANWVFDLMLKVSYKREIRMLCALLVQAREEVGLTQKLVADTGIKARFLKLKMDKELFNLLF